MVRRRDVSLLLLVVAQLVIGTHSQALSVDPAECRSLMDLYIVIDGSDSVSYKDFNTLQEAIASLVYQIDIGPNKARLGMLVYSSDVAGHNTHPFYDNPQQLVDAAMTLGQPRDGTNTNLGLKRMRDIFDLYGRQDVPWVCVTITDGISKSRSDTMAEAKLAEKMGINMFAVGVGHRIDMEELRGIGSNERQVIALNNFNQLSDMLQSIMTTICPCPTPPSVHLAKCADGPRAIGSVRQYQCQDGYLQRGNGAITCRDDSTWTPLSMDFECVACSDITPIVHNGLCSGGDYTIGTVRTYTCDPGYLAVGKPDIVCKPNAVWSKPKIECTPCGETPIVKHGSCGGGEYTLGSVRQFTCEPGYLAVGNPEIVCQTNAVWNTPKFQCIPCGDTPVIDRGKCGGGDYTLGSRRNYVCDPGYLAVGQSEIVCQDNAIWSKPQMKCIPCGDTPVIENGVCGGGDYTLGSKRQFSCELGYLAVGNPEIICQDNALWTRPQFKCVPCGATPSIDHGTCGTGKNILGAKRYYTCYPGYLAVGSPEILCQNDAIWSTPQFQCIPCGDTPVITHGTCDGGDNTLGSRRQFRCNPGYFAVGNPEIVCQDNAVWSSPKFQCVPCGDTPTIDNGLCGGGEYTLGSRRHFTCNPGYLAVGNPEIICQDNAIWSTPTFQCVPCGDTPAIDHGTCGGGEYKIGSRRHFTCNSGYLAVGNSEIICQDNAVWSAPQFQCVPCGDTPFVDNGICGGGKYTLGARRHFTCNTGYLAVGNPEIVCQDNAVWSAPVFQCVPCGDTPVIDFGTCGGGEYTLGSRRHFTCNSGYLAVGNSEIICQDNAVWSAPQFQCVPCGDTPFVDNGICGGGKYTLGARRHFTCNTGYLAVGNPEIVCQDNAVWSAPVFQCVPCGDTPVIDFGTCGGGEYTLGSRRHFTCNSGYLAVGNPEIVCQDNAVWSAPVFQCVPCGDTPVIDFGTCGGGEYTLGSRRHFTCNSGYLAVGNPEIICQDNAVWSAPQFQCVPCGDTPIVDNGICDGGEYTLGARRHFTCNPGYLAVGNPGIVCQDNAVWSTPQVKCMPCGNTPIIEHGTCDGGEYTLGSKRLYTCQSGYLAVGSPEIVCQDNAVWSTPQIKCMPCGNTPDIDHGSCGGGNYTRGSVRHYTCEQGYLAVGNPDIVCQDNAIWSTPQVKCMPCGPTPTIDHGTCGGGHKTIGSKRTFTCEPGYYLKGSATIVCQDDATWSVPDLVCIPCDSNTPVVPNAVCGSGDVIVGSSRTYTCNNGYMSVGSPVIKCLPDATWSKPTLTCKDCGVPPTIPNAFTGLGPSTIGAFREYHCDVGYQMRGRGQITCRPDGQWEHPRFSCNVITTTTTTTPAPKPLDPSVCDACRLLNGVGYNNHPFDCNQYVQCFVGRNGMEPVYRRCPFGLFWDQDILTCRPSHLVTCSHDKCASLDVKGYKHSNPDSCCSYWKCQDGKSYGECCGEGSSYDPLTGQCVYDDSCHANCPYEEELQVCSRRPMFEETVYEQHIGMGHWVKMPCAPGTAYNPVDCECSLLLMHVPGKRRQQVCKPELYLPFHGDFADRSGKNVYVHGENIDVRNGSAYFNGNSRLMINRFSNTEFHGHVVIRFRYRENLVGPTAGSLQALVTNGDCGSDPSIIIAKMPGYVLLGAKTHEPRSFALPTLDKEWKEVIYIHNEKKLEGKVCGATGSKWSYGPIQATHCAIQIGYGNGLDNFVGDIDDLYIYQCRPRASVLNLEY